MEKDKKNNIFKILTMIRLFDDFVGYGGFILIVLAMIFQVYIKTATIVEKNVSEIEATENPKEEFSEIDLNFDSLSVDEIRERLGLSKELSKNLGKKVDSVSQTPKKLNFDKLVSLTSKNLPKTVSGLPVEVEFESCFNVPNLIEEVGLYGEVVFQVKISNDGFFKDLEIVKDELYGVCVAEAVRCLKEIKWVPPTDKNQKNIESEFILPLKFEEKRDEKDWDSFKSVMKADKVSLPFLDKNRSSFVNEKEKSSTKDLNPIDFSSKLKNQADTTIYNLYDRRVQREETLKGKIDTWKSYLLLEPEKENYDKAFTNIVTYFMLTDESDSVLIKEKEIFWEENSEQIESILKN